MSTIASLLGKFGVRNVLNTSMENKSPISRANKVDKQSNFQIPKLKLEQHKTLIRNAVK